MLQLDTRNFGRMSIDESEIIRFELGILGFEDVHEYALLGDQERSGFFWLQSVDGSDVSLIVADPFALYPKYSVNLDTADSTLLAVKDPEKLLTLCVIVIPMDIRDMRMNLKAPLLINLENRKGIQIVQYEEDLPIRFYLLQQE